MRTNSIKLCSFTQWSATHSIFGFYHVNLLPEPLHRPSCPVLYPTLCYRNKTRAEHMVIMYFCPHRSKHKCCCLFCETPKESAEEPSHSEDRQDPKENRRHNKWIIKMLRVHHVRLFTRFCYSHTELLDFRELGIQCMWFIYIYLFFVSPGFSCLLWWLLSKAAFRFSKHLFWSTKVIQTREWVNDGRTIISNWTNPVYESVLSQIFLLIL